MVVQKKDGEGMGMVVIEEEGEGAGVTANSNSGSSKRGVDNGDGGAPNTTVESVVGALGEEDAVGEDEEGDEDDGEDGHIGVGMDYAWDEGYEQEV